MVIFVLGNEDPKTAKPDGQEPMSLPHISVNNNQTFSYKNPAYQSAHPQINSDMIEVVSNNSKSNASSSTSTKPQTSKSDDGSNRSKSRQHSLKGKPVQVDDDSQSMPIGENYEVKKSLF